MFHGRQFRDVQAAGLEVAQHDSPRLAALAVAILHSEQLLLAVLANAEHDEQAHAVVLAEAARR